MVEAPVALVTRQITARVTITGMTRPITFGDAKRSRDHDEKLATFWRRLGFDRHAPSRKCLEQEIGEALAKSVRDEIDREMLSALMGVGTETLKNEDRSNPSRSPLAKSGRKMVSRRKRDDERHPRTTKH